MKGYTTREAAAALGLSRRTVQNWCSKLGHRPIGRDYVLTEDELEAIRAVKRDAPGRPPKNSR